MAKKKLNTKDVKTGSDYTPKNIEPGNIKAKINDIELDQPEFLKKEDAYFVVLHLETEKPNESFVGFHVDWQDENSPTYDGQTGKVKSSKWSYRDATIKNDITIERDVEIMKFIKNLCEALDLVEWWNKQNNKHDDIESLVNTFNKEKPFKDIWLNWCIGGRQYQKQNGYKGWDLHLPKFSREGIPFEALSVTNSRLITFNSAEHTEIAEAKPLDDFGTENEVLEPGDEFPEMDDNTDFEL